MARMVNCIKLGREAEGLDFPPVPGRTGQETVGKRFEGSVAGSGTSIRRCWSTRTG